MRAIVREILARRMPEPPAEFVALQVSRLNEALLVAYGAMSGANLSAVDRVVKIVRELDRYHGFVSVERRSLPEAPRLEGPAQETLSLDALATDRLTMAPQQPEMIASAPGNGMAAQVLNWPPQEGAELASPLAAPASDPLALAALVADPLLTPKPLDRCHAHERGLPESPADAAIRGDIEILALRRLDPHVGRGDRDGRRHDPEIESYGRLETAPQAPEKPGSAPGNGIAPEGSNPKMRRPGATKLSYPFLTRNTRSRSNSRLPIA